MFSTALPGSASLYGSYKSQVRLVIDYFYSSVRVWSACEHNGQKMFSLKWLLTLLNVNHSV